jgi:predicted  nucleic acid-binding Zn-ribbon protein
MRVACVSCFAAGAAAASDKGSPVQKVIELLGSLSAKIVAEGDAENRQYESFVEWCEDNAKEMQHELANANEEVEGLEASIEQAKSGIETAESRISELSDSIAEDEQELEKATDVRTTERKDWAKTDKSLAETIDTLTRAIAAMKVALQHEGEKGGAEGAFMQLDRVAVNKLVSSLSTLVDGSIFSTHDTKQVQAFLQSQQQESEGVSNEGLATVIQVLEDMLAKAESQRSDATKAETDAKFNFEMVKAALKQRGSKQNDELADTKKELASHRESLAVSEGDLKTAKKEQSTDASSLQTLQVDCMQTATDHEASVQGRSEELKALAAAKKIIEEKTGGAASRSFLLQISSDTESDQDNIVGVVQMLRTLGRKQNSMQISFLASKASSAVASGEGKDVFAKVKGLIEGMIQKLLEEAQKEGAEKAFCDKEMKETEEKKAEHEEDIDALTGKMNKADASIISLTNEIATLEAELGNIATSQKEMDQNRADEHKDYESASTDYQQGVEGVQMAIKVLKEYYGQSFLQQPAVGTHSASGGTAGGIIGLLEVAESDFSKLLAEVEADEKSAQNEYEAQTKANQISKTEKETALKYKNKEKAETEKALEELKADTQGEQSELDAVLDYYSGIKKRCIAKPEPYEERKRRREQEIEGLKQALDVLENETAFLAVRTVRRHI